MIFWVANFVEPVFTEEPLFETVENEQFGSNLSA